MIEALTISNFKAFGTPQAVPLRPITLIFGPNSAGKSSILHSLLFTHEAVRTGDLDVRYTQLGGESVDLGGFDQLTFRRDRSRPVVLSFQSQWLPEIGKHPIKLKDVEVRSTLQVDESAFEDLDTKASALWEQSESVFGEDISNNAILKRKLAAKLLDTLASEETGSDPQGKMEFLLQGDDEAALGVRPALLRFEILSGGEPILSASRRSGSGLRIDRFATGHPVFQEIIKTLVLANTTTELFTEADAKAVSAELDSLLPGIDIESNGIICRAPLKSGAFPLGEELLAMLPRDNRTEELRKQARLFFPPLLSRLLEAAASIVTDFCSSLHYLGPLRAYPPRHISLESLGEEGVSEGLDAWKIVLKDTDIRRKVNGWLGSEFLQTKYELGVNAQIPSQLVSEGLESGVEELVSELEENFKKSQEEGEDLESPYADLVPKELHEDLLMSIINRCRGSSVRELTLRDRSTGTVVSHRDIGIGVSQLLPVLVKAYASRNATVAIEQPEIHLHPALQAELADVFIESALGEQKNTYILETHSEHLILRLLRRIRETAENKLPAGKTPIRPEDVAILYVKPGKEGSRVICLPPNSEGDFDQQWPDGFFEERAKELF